MTTANRLPTFSSLDRARACPGSCALPHVQTKTKYAEKGDAIHAFVLSKKRGDAALPDIPKQYHEICESIDIEAIPVGRYEVTFGLDIDTGISRIIGENLNRRYPNDLRAGELVGTADIYGETTIGEKKAVYIGDVKSGLAEHVPPVRECLQTSVAAVAACRLTGYELAITEIIRINDTGVVSREPAVFDNWALDAIELEVRDLVARVRNELAIADSGGVVNVSIGPQCKFCPAYSHCPAQKNLAMALADPQGLEKEIMGALTPTSAPVVYKKLRAAQEMINKIRSALYGYAEQQEFDIGNGFVLGPVRVVRPKLDAAMVHRLLAKDYGAVAANKAVDWKTSKRAVKAVLREFCRYGTLGKTEAKILAELQMEGGLVQESHIEIRPHRGGIDALEGDD